MLTTVLRWMVMSGLIFGLFQATAQAAEINGSKFADQIELNGQNLLLNGVGARKISFFTAYVAGLYVQSKSSDAASIFSEAGTKRIEIRMQHNANAKNFSDALHKGLSGNYTAEQLAGFKSQTDRLYQLISAIGTLKENDVIAIDWIPQVGTQLELNGQPQGSAISGESFYVALLSIFIGGHPVDHTLKQRLLGQDN